MVSTCWEDVIIATLVVLIVARRLSRHERR